MRTAARPKVRGRTRDFRDRFDDQGSPSGQRHAAHWFYAGFKEIHNTGRGGAERAEVSKITNREEMKRWIDGYDIGIRYVDKYVDRVVRLLKDAGVYDDSAIIVSADHGENQGELRIYGEHATANVATCRVPMIIRWPGMPVGRSNVDLHYTLNLAPTRMDC